MKSGCRMIHQVICTLSFAIRCCHGLPASPEKESTFSSIHLTLKMTSAQVVKK